MNYYDYYVKFRDNYIASVLDATRYAHTTTNAGYTVDFGEKDKVVADVEYVELSSEPVKEGRNDCRNTY